MKDIHKLKEGIIEAYRLLDQADRLLWGIFAEGDAKVRDYRVKRAAEHASQARRILGEVLD